MQSLPCSAVARGEALLVGIFKNINCMQGIGVRLSPLQAGTPAFREAIMEVLSNPRYTAAAQAMSVKIRARKNTPVQEAVGERPAQHPQNAQELAALRSPAVRSCAGTQSGAVIRC